MTSIVVAVQITALLTVAIIALICLATLTRFQPESDLPMLPESSPLPADQSAASAGVKRGR